jgi:hypothetical protein
MTGTNKIHFLKNLPALKGGHGLVKHGIWAEDILQLVDKRTRIGKAAIRLGQELVAHVDGKPSIVQQIIIEDIISLFVELKLYEANLLKDKSPGSRDRRLAFSNTLRLHCQALGIEKKKEKPVDLGEYLSRKRKGTSD